MCGNTGEGGSRARRIVRSKKGVGVTGSPRAVLDHASMKHVREPASPNVWCIKVPIQMAPHLKYVTFAKKKKNQKAIC